MGQTEEEAGCGSARWRRTRGATRSVQPQAVEKVGAPIAKHTSMRKSKTKALVRRTHGARSGACARGGQGEGEDEGRGLLLDVSFAQRNPGRAQASRPSSRTTAGGPLSGAGGAAAAATAAGETRRRGRTRIASWTAGSGVSGGTALGSSSLSVAGWGRWWRRWTGCDAQRRRWKGLHQHAARRTRGAAGASSRLTGSWHTLLEAPSASFEDKASLSRQPPRGPCTALLLSPPKGSWGLLQAPS